MLHTNYHIILASNSPRRKELLSGIDIPYEIYKPLLEEFNLDYIAPIAIIKNGEYDNFIRCLEQNIFLIKDGQGFGEGIVINLFCILNVSRYFEVF